MFLLYSDRLNPLFVPFLPNIIHIYKYIKFFYLDMASMIQSVTPPYMNKCQKCKKNGLIVATSDSKNMCHLCLAKHCETMENVMATIASKICTVCPMAKRYLRKPPVPLKRIPLVNHPVKIGISNGYPRGMIKC
jgi:hypothetical protein